jgi:hypothetical protein
MKITNVSHYVSAVGKEACAENIHFIIQGAKFEALAAQRYTPMDLQNYKNWLKSAEVRKSSRKKSVTNSDFAMHNMLSAIT